MTCQNCDLVHTDDELGERRAEPRKFKVRDLDVVDDLIGRLCKTIWNNCAEGHIWSIPANPEKDFDFILSDVVEELRQLRAERTQLVEKLAQAEETRDAAQAEATRQTLLAREYQTAAEAAAKDLVDLDRLKQQARDISVQLSDAGCSAMPISDAVFWLIRRHVSSQQEAASLRAALDSING